MLWQFSNDTRRDDVGTSKCLHCTFNRDCAMAPNYCAFVDDRTPMHRLSFSLVTDNSKTVYDCGWLVLENVGPLAVPPSDLGQYIRIKQDMMFFNYKPFSLNLCIHMAVPKPGESMDEYRERVETAISLLSNRSDDNKLSETQMLKNIVKAIGKENDLKEIYDNNIRFFADDYWPGSTFKEILAMYYEKSAISDREYLANRRRLEKEAACEKSN